MSLLLKRALDHAAVWHRGQRRKYPGVEVPYVSHVAGVVAVLAGYGFDDEVQAAGALHDVIEDCGVTRDEIAQRFGDRVAALVDAVSEQDKSLPWEERKRRYIERFAHEPWDAQAISLADKVDNFESMLVCAADHGDPWSMFKRGKDAQLWRFEAIRSTALTLAPHPLIERYCATLDALRAV